MTINRSLPLGVKPTPDAHWGSIYPNSAKAAVLSDALRGVDVRRRSMVNALVACVGSAATWPALAQPNLRGHAAGPATPDIGVALVLGSGGCRGHAHIGVIRVLEEQGLRPDLVVGSSAGSLVGALYSSGLSARAIEQYGGQMDSQMMREWTIPRLGMFGGDRIPRFINERVGRRTIESLHTRYAAVATDLRTGELVTLNQGDLATAVQASSSVPGLVEPVNIGNRLCVDGSLVAPVPVAVARILGARLVIACDVTFPPLEADQAGPFDALYQGFSILTRRLALEQRAGADIVIAPRLPIHREMKPATVTALMNAGETATRRQMPAIHALFARSRDKRISNKRNADGQSPAT
jgi:NTE family protein